MILPLLKMPLNPNQPSILQSRSVMLGSAERRKPMLISHEITVIISCCFQDMMSYRQKNVVSYPTLVRPQNLTKLHFKFLDGVRIPKYSMNS